MSAVNSSTGLNNSYTYDADGLRLTKTIGDIEHKYVWQGSRLVSENWAGQELEFFYDESGSPYAFSYKSSATATPVMYYYVTNLQGDVVNILNASGSTVASYSYNAWGKVLTATGTMAAVNPLRYRGYYYDTDTGLYYLQSRYYDPEICRFINADSNVSTGQGFVGTNMFAYCLNNPVSYADSEGAFAQLVAVPLLAVLAPIAYSVAVATAITTVFIAAIYFVDVAVGYANDAIVQAKKSSSNAASGGSADMGGGAASPTPPGNGNWNNKNNDPRDPKYRGDSTYNKNGIRIDYEYYGSNGNGNVHLHTNNGKYIYDFSAKVFRTQSGAIAPRSIQSLTRNQQIMRALYKGLKYIT